MKKDIVKNLTTNAIVATLYFLLTLINPLSFGMIQVRISEILILLCFFNRNYTFGITIGCLLANTFSPASLGIVDIIFGTLATFASCLSISFFKHLALGAITPILINGFAVAGELVYVTDVSLPYIAVVGFVALGEFVAITIGYLIFIALRKNGSFFDIIRANQNTDYRW